MSDLTLNDLRVGECLLDIAVEHDCPDSRPASVADLRSVLAGLSDSELNQLGGERKWQCINVLTDEPCPAPMGDAMFPCGWRLLVRLPEKEDTGG